VIAALGTQGLALIGIKLGSTGEKRVPPAFRSLRLPDHAWCHGAAEHPLHNHTFMTTSSKVTRQERSGYALGVFEIKWALRGI